MEGNIGGKLIWRLAVETKNAHFISAKFNILQWCVGVHVRRDYRQVSSRENWHMALFKYFSRGTSVLKQSLSLAQKEKEVVSDFVSEAEKEAHCVHSKNAIFNSANKKQWFSHETAQYNSHQYYPPYCTPLP